MFFSRLYTQGWFSRDVHTGRLFLFACPPMVHLLSIYISTPPNAGKQKIDAISVPFAIMPAIDRWTDFQDSALSVLADALISRIKHCPRWQTSRFLKFCIVVVDRYPDFQNSALLDFYKIEQSKNSALLTFRRMNLSGKLHCQFPWVFTQYELNQRIYITNRQCWFSEINTSV